MNPFQKAFLLLVPPLASVLAMGATPDEKSPLPAFRGRIKGYVVPAKDYVLKGDSAEFRSADLVWLDGITLKTRRGGNQLNFLVTTPGGEYRRKEDLISSTNSLDVRSLDDRFQLSGVGYDYRPATNQLIIHSNVITRFDQQLFERGKPGTIVAGVPTNRPPLEITADGLEFEGATGEAVYPRNVHLTDGDQLEVDAGRLELNIAALTNVNRRVMASEDVRLKIKMDRGLALAHSDTAVFSTAPGLDGRVELSGNPVWTNQLLSGSATRLDWQIVSNRYTFVGEGGAKVRFPLAMFGTNQPSTNRFATTNLEWIDVASESHRFVAGRLQFDTNVVARQSTNWLMRTRSLVVELDATNRPERLVADQDFVFESFEKAHRGNGRADHADVRYQADGRPVVTLTGQPRWTSDEMENRADRIEVIDPLGDPVYSGDGHVQFKLTGLRAVDLDWFGATTNSSREKAVAKSTNSEPVLITADQSHYHAGWAEFTGNVLATSTTNSLAAGQLTLWLTPDGHVTNMVASGGAKVRAGKIVLAAPELKARFDGTERNLPQVEASGGVHICAGLQHADGRGISQHMTYDAKSGVAWLAGDPKLFEFDKPAPGTRNAQPPVMFEAGQPVWWNLRDETFGTRGRFSAKTDPPPGEIPLPCD